MFEILMAFFVLFNAIALLILLTSCICTLLTNSKLSKLATSKVALPKFIECKSTMIKCCVASTLFVLLDWLLYSGAYVSKEKIAGNEIIAEYTLLFSVIWAAMIAVLALVDIITKFQKNKTASIRDAFIPVIGRALWCFVLTFIIA